MKLTVNGEEREFAGETLSDLLASLEIEPVRVAVEVNLDIIPKAESGRYMGISNVVTAGSGLLANASGALLAAGVILATGSANLGYRSIMLLMIVEFALGAWALSHVREPRRS